MIQNKMYNHSPKNYHCPFCLLAQGIENEHVRSRQSDIVYKDKFILAFISSDWWPNNPGHVLIAPLKHIENIYALPDELNNRIHRLEKRIALAIKKSYRADGTSSRQHNEPNGGQDVWHYHLAVFPRYKNDELYLNTYKRAPALPYIRARYAKKLKKTL